MLFGSVSDDTTPKKKNAMKSKDCVKKHIGKKLIALTSLGVILVMLPVAAMFIDPIFIIAKQKLKLAKGSNIHKLLLSDMEGTRLSLTLFNITNAPQFQSGKDSKIKFREVGPFVYQEYRSNKNIEFDSEAGVVLFTPQTRTVFLPEQSLGQPEDFIVNLPNIPFLGTAAVLSPYTFIIHNIFNIMTGPLHPKSIIQISAHDYLWGYDNPIAQTVQSLIPGLVYYNSSGVLERLYDDKVEYKLVMGTAGEDKFKVKTVYKYVHDKIFGNTQKLFDKLELNNTYEGAAFRVEMTPEMPLSVYRLGIWQTYQMKYVGKRHTEFGVDAFVYDFDNKTFDNTNLCDSNGFCPRGIIDISHCFVGLPVALSKVHLLDSNPRLLDRLEGITPDRKKHSSYILVEPKIGVTIGTSLLMQLNLVLNDLSFNHETSSFSNMVLPILYCNFTFPELPSETKNALSLMYVTGPKILLACEIASCLLGLALLCYSVMLSRCCRSQREYQSAGRHSPLTQKVTAELPLIQE